MANYCYRGHFGTDYATIVVRSDTAGTITTSPGADQSAYADPAVDDGMVSLRLSGLHANTEYPVTVMRNGIAIDTSLTVKTAPVAGGTWTIAWGSCVNRSRDEIAAYEIVNRHAPRAFFACDDWPYNNWSTPSFGASGEPDPVIAYSGITVQEMWANHRQMLRRPGEYYLRRNAGFLYQPGDHGWMGNDWKHTVATAEDVRVASPATQAEVDAHFWVGKQAVMAYSKGNPSPPAGAVNEKSPNADAATPASQYPPSYFFWQPNADVEFFMLDDITHRGDNGVTVFGSTQKTLLKARLLASTATWKIIVCAKKLYVCVKDNGDTLAATPTERNEILQYIHDNNIRGVVWLVGDRHQQDVEMVTVSGGASFDAFAVNSSPIGIDPQTEGQGSGYPTGIRVKWNGYTGTHQGARQGYGVCKIVGAQYLEIALYQVGRGRWWWCRLMPTDNVPTYVRPALA